ncbi:MAG: methylated-DNA--[protein]-cysteine S-methyltransferase [Planctomycetes bacterium]|nr:methylated-DNA--[protein]-cysteine S-methyltransferase [Planctomycetota bacterium]
MKHSCAPDAGRLAPRATWFRSPLPPGWPMRELRFRIEQGRFAEVRFARAGSALPSLPEPWAGRLRRYFSGRREDLTRWPVVWPRVGPFLRKALEACRRIPGGARLTYGALSRAAGRPRAARAAASAMARNPLPLLIPCHRVVPVWGGTGAYGPGADLKRRLLALEGLTPSPATD